MATSIVSVEEAARRFEERELEAMLRLDAPSA
jgi:hypothetical protein